MCAKASKFLNPLKGTVHPKMIICRKFPHPQVIQDEFDSYFFTGGSVTNDRFIFLQTQLFTSEDVGSCGLLVDYCDVFISCLDSHSDGTHSLQMIQICSDEETISSTANINDCQFWKILLWERKKMQ